LVEGGGPAGEKLQRVVRRRIRRSAVLPDVLEGRINPGRVSDYTTDLVGIGDATPP
jgi:hypothetical protein